MGRVGSLTRRAIAVPVLSLSVLAAGGAWAAPITIDGSLAEWGVTVADNNGSIFTSLAGNIGIKASSVEDQDDNAADGGYVGPYYGGQNYDVEFMAIALQGTRAYIAISTGIRPDNGEIRFGPGDIRVRNLGTNELFGIEVGGGQGGQGGGLMTEGQAGSTYALDSHGYTQVGGHSAADAQQVTGSIWRDVSWLQSPIDGTKDVQFAVTGSSVRLDTLYAPVEYRYTRDADPTSQHAIIEMSFDIRTFLDGSDSGILDFEWGPNCYNDFLHVTVGIVPGFNQLPEPGSLAVFGIGLFGLAAWRKRKSSRPAA